MVQININNRTLKSTGYINSEEKFLQIHLFNKHVKRAKLSLIPTAEKLSFDKSKIIVSDFAKPSIYEC